MLNRIFFSQLSQLRSWEHPVKQETMPFYCDILYNGSIKLKHSLKNVFAVSPTKITDQKFVCRVGTERVLFNLLLVLFDLQLQMVQKTIKAIRFI